jgi:ribonuclease P protein component
VFAAPRRSSDRYFTVLVRDNAGSHARLGLAVAKKRVRLAVGRNRIKRLVRESFRHNAHLLGAVDVIVLSRFDGNADNPTLSQSLVSHWKRLRAKHRRSGN